ncbi:MAG: hypothetical protein JWN43_1541 [Gammaproteobacteria bacterium]|nr:hypothetical protein [Gammaproteobacteria bacterium]
MRSERASSRPRTPVQSRNNSAVECADRGDSSLVQVNRLALLGFDHSHADPARLILWAKAAADIVAKEQQSKRHRGTVQEIRRA